MASTQNGMTTYSLRELTKDARDLIKSEVRAAGKPTNYARFTFAEVIVGERQNTHLVAHGYVPSENRDFSVRSAI